MTFFELLLLVQFQKWLISFIFFTQLLQLTAGQCPSGYQTMAGQCAMLSSNRMPWQQAMDTCTKDNATMFFVTKQSDWDTIVQNIPQQQLANIWMGLHYDTATSPWSWADGSPYDPAKDWAPWGSGQPNTNAGQCVSIKYDIKLKKMAWFVVSCGTTLAPICVKSQATTIGTGTPFTFPSFAAVTCPPGFNAFGGQCMLYSQNPVSYQDAEVTCMANNSHVLFAKEEWLWKYAEYFIGSQLPSFWVGLSYNTATQQFEWADGTVYNPATDWAAWCPGQPGDPSTWPGNCVNSMQDYNSGSYCWYMADCTQGLYGVCLLNMPTTTAPLTTTTIPTTVATTTVETTSSLPTTAIATSTSAPTAAATTSAAMKSATQATSIATTVAPLATVVTSQTPEATVVVTTITSTTPAPVTVPGTVATPAVVTGPSPATTTHANPTSPSVQPTTVTGYTQSSIQSGPSTVRSMQPGLSTASTSKVNPTLSTALPNMVPGPASTSKVSTITGIPLPPATSGGPLSSAVAMTTRPQMGTVSGCSPKTVGDFSPLLTNGYLSYTPLQIVQNVSSNDCALACLGKPSCGSFDWNQQTRECHLLQQRFANDCTYFVMSSNYQHYDLMNVNHACYC